MSNPVASPALRDVEGLIEKHARKAVLPLQAQNDSYRPTPYEANALNNWRHILREFANALSALSASPSQEQKNKFAEVSAGKEAEQQSGGRPAEENRSQLSSSSPGRDAGASQEQEQE